MSQTNFSFTINKRLKETDPKQNKTLARSATIKTPNGSINTPAFIPVGTKATVKSVLPENIKNLAAQAILANAYHLYLQPGPEILEMAGGLAKFMNWKGPTFTDSGGFQVMSLGAGFKKVILMEKIENEKKTQNKAKKERLAFVDDDGVTFKSHLDGKKHRFTPEISMQVQHKIGADIIFGFDELTTLLDSKQYQEKALERTRLWAIRCIQEHEKLTKQNPKKPYQALFGVIQGAQYEDLRRKACKDLATMNFDGFGIGGALEKENLGKIVRWCNEELPENKPKHLLGISEPNDIFIAIENGIDTFDCVSPSRVARTSAVYSPYGRFNISNARFKTDFKPIFENCDCYTCANYSRAYLHHLFRAKEMLASTLATIHNERFIIKLVDTARKTIETGDFFAYKQETLQKYYNKQNYQPTTPKP